MVEPESRRTPAGAPPEVDPGSRIEALIRLLGDEDPKIHRTAWTHLEEMGSEALVRVEAAARSSQDPGVRKQAERFVVESARREVLQEWVAFSRKNIVDLEEGAVLISRSEYPSRSAEEVRRELDGIAGVLTRRLATVRSTEGAMRKLVGLLVEDLGFSGRRASYEDPDASYIHRVLETKTGLPILLSTVYLLVARRAGLSLQGVSMPQHFLLKYRTKSGEVFVDPFNDGQALSSLDCRNFLEASGIAFSESYLREAADREVLSRMLGNLFRLYHAQQDQRRLNRVLAMLQTLEAGAQNNRSC